MWLYFSKLWLKLKNVWLLELRLRELWLWLNRVHVVDLSNENCGHNQGEEDG